MVSAIFTSVREVDQLVVQGLGYVMVYMAGWAVWQCLCTTRVQMHVYRTVLVILVLTCANIDTGRLHLKPLHGQQVQPQLLMGGVHASSGVPEKHVFE